MLHFTAERRHVGIVRMQASVCVLNTRCPPVEPLDRSSSSLVHLFSRAYDLVPYNQLHYQPHNMEADTTIQLLQEAVDFARAVPGVGSQLTALVESAIQVYRPIGVRTLFTLRPQPALIPLLDYTHKPGYVS